MVLASFQLQESLQMSACPPKCSADKAGGAELDGIAYGQPEFSRQSGRRRQHAGMLADGNSAHSTMEQMRFCPTEGETSREVLWRGNTELPPGSFLSIATDPEWRHCLGKPHLSERSTSPCHGWAHERAEKIPGGCNFTVEDCLNVVNCYTNKVPTRFICQALFENFM